MVWFALPLKVYLTNFVLHECATAYKHLDTKINAVCFAQNIEILAQTTIFSAKSWLVDTGAANR